MIDVIVTEGTMGQRIKAIIKKGDQPGVVQDNKVNWVLEPADAGIVTVAQDTMSVDVAFGTVAGAAKLTATADKNLSPDVTEEIMDVANITFAARVDNTGADSLTLEAEPVI